MTTEMAEGLARYREQQRLNAIERVATWRAWQLSLSTVTLIEVEFGHDSEEAAVARKRHAERWHGVTFPMPTSHDFTTADMEA